MLKFSCRDLQYFLIGGASSRDQPSHDEPVDPDPRSQYEQVVEKRNQVYRKVS